MTLLSPQVTRAINRQSQSAGGLGCHSICGYAERVLIFLSFFLRKNNSGEYSFDRLHHGI